MYRCCWKKKTATESKASALLKIGQVSVVVVDVIIRHGVRMCIAWIELSWVGLGWFVFRHILGNTLYVDWVVDGGGSKKRQKREGCKLCEYKRWNEIKKRNKHNRDYSLLLPLHTLPSLRVRTNI